MRYLALGDSFTIGTGTTPDLSFPAMLARRWRERDIECDLRNPAVNGFTTDDLIREELPLLETYAPDLVTILIGANDIVAGSSEGRYRAQLRRIHERITAVVPRARRYALPQPDWSVAPASVAFGDPADVGRTIERFNEIARDEATRAGGTYVDIFPLMREQMRAGMTAPDRLHPSAAAYAAWADALEGRLAPTLS